MNAAQALMAAKAANISLQLEGERLVLEAATQPPQELLELLVCHKADIIRLLRPVLAAEWTVEDWQALYDERAGICEYDGGLPRAEAEATAFAHCLAEWLHRNPSARRLANAWAVVMATAQLIGSYPSALKRTPGCIHVAGLTGTHAERQKP